MIKRQEDTYHFLNTCCERIPLRVLLVRRQGLLILRCNKLLKLVFGGVRRSAGDLRLGRQSCDIEGMLVGSVIGEASIGKVGGVSCLLLCLASIQRVCLAALVSRMQSRWHSSVCGK